MKVKAFEDIPELFVQEEGESEMGSQRKSTPERLDKMIKFIWDYQQKHNGETPKMHTIGTHIGLTTPMTSTSFWINKLVDAGRLNKISSQPFRVTITDHKDNQRAITSYKRLLAAKEEHEAKERDEIRARQAREAAAAAQEADRQAIFEAAEREKQAALVAANNEREEKPGYIEQVPGGAVTTEPVVAATHDVRPERRLVPTNTTPAPRPFPVNDRTVEEVDNEDRLYRWKDARRNLLDAQKDLKAAMPQLVKLAETRDLMCELVERGFVVSKR